jgi:molecular chaperone Hsp33
VIDPIVEQVPVDDVLHRFMLERAGVRGVLVRLGASWREIASRAEYPDALRDLLGQSVAASALLTGNIKLQGSLSLEFRSSGPLRLLFAECNDEGQLRGLARWEEPLPETLELAGLPDALMAITIGHVERGQRYQGLVDLNAPTVAGAIENYFAQSEQLPARILLAADGDHAVGLMLQMLPGEGGHSAVQDDEDDPWARVSLLTDTLGAEEMLNTSPEEILYRLYHEETVRLFEPRELAFGCSCTRERVEAVLRSLGREEVEAALAARDGEIEVICEFCAERYTFDPVDAEHLLADGTIQASSSTLH